MIAMKDMEMPNACVSTQETLGDIEVANCPLYNICKNRETIRTNYKPSNCPLVEIITCNECKHNAYEIAKIRDSEPTRIYCEKNKTHPCIDNFCAEAERRE